MKVKCERMLERARETRARLEKQMEQIKADQKQRQKKNAGKN